MLAVIGGWCQHRTTMRETVPEMVFGLQRLAGHRLRRGKMSEIIYKYFSIILHGERKVRVAGMDGLGGIGLDVDLLLDCRDGDDVNIGQQCEKQCPKWCLDYSALPDTV
jgi:hypothetical protein